MGKRLEPFQSFKHGSNFRSYGFVPIYNKNQVMLTVPILDRAQCTTLCTGTPRCIGFNYFPGKCTLYKGKETDFINIM